MHRPSLPELNQRAHPNSILARKFPNGATPSDLPFLDADRDTQTALTNTGFHDDYPDYEKPGWDRRA